MAKNNKKPFYTEDQRIRRVWDIENIKDLMNRRGFYVANDMRREELNDFWVNTAKYQKTASLGSNWGYYVGMDEISNFYVVKYVEERQKLLDAYCAANPKVKNTVDNLGYGCMVFYPVSTPLITLSGDGYTAQGNWYACGNESKWKPNGPASCHWYYDKIAVDFVKENGEWKIWHMIISNDLHVEAGQDYNNLSSKPDISNHPAMAEFLSGKPTIEMLTHNLTLNWCDHYPPLPKEVFHYEDEMGYGPQGHPKYKEKFSI